MTKYLKWFGIDLFDFKAIRYFNGLLDKLITDRGTDGKDKDFLQLCLDKIVEPNESDSTTHKDKFGGLWTEKGKSWKKGVTAMNLCRTLHTCTWMLERP